MAHGLRGNLTQSGESSLKPDCSIFESDRRKPGRAAPRGPGTAAYFLEKLTDAR
jgi:hypothetical protein